MAKPISTRGDKTPTMPPATQPASKAGETPKESELPGYTPPPKSAKADVAGATAAGAPDQAASDDERRRRIAEAAYYRAERRNFAPGNEHADWLEAEQDVDRGTPTDLPPEDNEFPSPK